MSKKYAVSKRANVRVTETANTKASIYPVVAYKPFRKFNTRQAARNFKQSWFGSQLSIIDTQRQMVVR